MMKRAGSTFALVEARPTARLDQAREVLLVWFKERVEPAPAATSAAGGEPATTPPPETPAPQAQAGGE
jgi:hypothetical protein